MRWRLATMRSGPLLKYLSRLQRLPHGVPFVARRPCPHASCTCDSPSWQASELREASLRKMIQLALAESIPPRTAVASASFAHEPA